MELCNKTPFHASLFRGVINADRFSASVVVRVTYDIKDGHLNVADDQCWKVSSVPYACEYGKVSSDEVFYKGGVDLFVLGFAYLPANSVDHKVEVKVTIANRFDYSIMVYGNRVWEESNGKLVSSEPKWFSKIPLTTSYAFGGKDEWDELPIPFTSNPDGKGYYITEVSALGNELPNIESINNPITKWNDVPDPVGVGLCPSIFGPRLIQSIEFDLKTGELIKLDPTFFNTCFPELVLPELEPGDLVTVKGVTKDGIDLKFVIPELALELKLGFGNNISGCKLTIDEIGIEAEYSRVFITYRYPFRYTLIPLQKRFCLLACKGA